MTLGLHIADFECGDPDISLFMRQICAYLTNLFSLLSLVDGLGGIASLTKVTYWLNQNQRADAPSPVQQSALQEPSGPLHKTSHSLDPIFICMDTALRLPPFSHQSAFPRLPSLTRVLPGAGPSRQVDFSWDGQVVDTWPDLLSELFVLLCICCAV